MVADILNVLKNVLQIATMQSNALRPAPVQGLSGYRSVFEMTSPAHSSEKDNDLANSPRCLAK